ncbi:hypothetical protein DYY65_06450 [Nitrososphaera sp. AFS]|nr:hypothetical protein [Nitrososphaera sp. AFS]
MNLSNDYTGAKQLILVASTQDLASMTMTNYLLQHQSFRSDENKVFYSSSSHPNVRIYISNKSTLYMEFLDEIFPDAKAFVFLSQHRSQSRTKALTCHFPGNFGLNQFGGQRALYCLPKFTKVLHEETNSTERDGGRLPNCHRIKSPWPHFINKAAYVYRNRIYGNRVDRRECLFDHL